LRDRPESDGREAGDGLRDRLADRRVDDTERPRRTVDASRRAADARDVKRSSADRRVAICGEILMLLLQSVVAILELITISPDELVGPLHVRDLCEES
jgi:hypothetical protein